MDIHNKRDSNMKEPRTNIQAICKKKYHSKFHNKCNFLHYQKITNQFHFESQLTTKRVNKRRRSDILKSSQSWMCPWSQFGCFHFVPKEPLLCTKFFYLHLQCFIILSTKSFLCQYNTSIVACT